jgi:tetratricopeptide (TPR) repeat protein
MHRDGPLITATVALNGLDEYEGGGTVVEALSWDPSRPTADLATARSFEQDAALRLARGHVLLYPGFIRHGGGAITSGVRYILVMFFVDKNAVDHDRHCVGRAKHLVDDALGIDGAAGRAAARRAAAAPEERRKLLFDAVDECLEALERGADTKGEAAHAYLGLALLELGQVDAAVDALEDAVRASFWGRGF